MIKRMTGPDAMSANAPSSEVGIALSTLSRWLRVAGTAALVAKKKRKGPTTAKASSNTGRRTHDWTMQDKLRVVLEASELPEEELGAFLRREGLHREQLEQWRVAADPDDTTRTEGGHAK